MLPWSVAMLQRPIYDDFQVYLTAARLVRQNRSADIYDGANNGADPQQKFAQPGSIFAQAASQQGTTGVRLYLYPPALADMLVPLTFLSLNHACDLWLALDFLCLAATALLLAWSLGWGLFSWPTLAVFAALALARPVIWCLVLGQVTVLLLALWTAGIVLFCKNYARSSAILLALATVIKLSPVLVLVPFLFWRQWRWVRWYLCSIVVAVLVMLGINGAAVLNTFTRHVLPSMSGGVVEISNLSLVAGAQMLYVGFHGGDPWYPFRPPQGVTMFAKVLAAAAAALFLTFVYRARSTRPDACARVLALTALVSSCIAPVAWRHAYTVGMVPLVLLWSEALRGRIAGWRLVLLTAFTIEMNFVFDSLLVHRTQGVVLSFVPMILPTMSLVLAISMLTLPREQAAA